MPNEMRPCICAEIQEESKLTRASSPTASGGDSSRSSSISSDGTSDDHRNHSDSHPRTHVKVARRTSSSAAKYYLHNQDLDAPIIASVGRGRSYKLQMKESLQNLSTEHTANTECLLLMWRI